jgi:hypothetical protein
MAIATTHFFGILCHLLFKVIYKASVNLSYTCLFYDGLDCHHHYTTLANTE